MSSLALSFTPILEGLRSNVAAHMARLAPARVPLFTALYWYIGRTNLRLQRLYDRWRQNRLPLPRRPRPAPALRPREASQPSTPQSAPAPAAVVPPAIIRLPRRRFWVTAEIGYHAAGRLNHLTHLLAEPEFADFLRAAPQAARLLRPLLRMLSPDPLPALLALPPRPKRPRTPPARPAPLPPLRPAPAYVMAAARVWKRQDAWKQRDAGTKKRG